MSTQKKLFKDNDLILSPDADRLKYRSREDEPKTSVHCGQRKLLLSEVEFFTYYWDASKIANPVCVYAGAYPGYHILLLQKLFPSFEFHLYDPKFNEKPNKNKKTARDEENNKIHIYAEFFTDETAGQWANRKDVFFISDIRCDGPRCKNMAFGERLELEDSVWADMMAQSTWTKIMKPVQALLKFRLPYVLEPEKVDPSNPPKVKYLKGLLYL
jgi:hypothetical protein